MIGWLACASGPHAPAVPVPLAVDSASTLDSAAPPDSSDTGTAASAARAIGDVASVAVPVDLGRVGFVGMADLDGDGDDDVVATGDDGLAVVASPLDDAIDAQLAVGGALAAGADLDGDGLEDVVVGHEVRLSFYDSGGPVPTTDSEAARVLYGDASLASSRSAVLHHPPSMLGSSRYSVAFLAHSPGAVDLVVGLGPDDERRGQIWLLHGAPPDGSDLDAAAAATVVGAHSLDDLGAWVASAGDLDGDGDQEVFAAGSSAGWALDPASGASSVDDAVATIDGGGCSAGDADGDGVTDWAIVSLDRDDAGNEVTSAYVIPGPISGALTVATASSGRIRGWSADRLGPAVALLTDLDGDGAADLVAGVPGFLSTIGGLVAVRYGPVSGVVDIDGADLKIVAGAPDAELGAALAAGDVDGDALPDLAVTAPDAGDGTVYVIPGAAL